MAKLDFFPQMVFPSSKMYAVNKLITEGSLTRLINKLIDTESYIIPPSSATVNFETTPKTYTSTETGTVTLVEIQNPGTTNTEDFEIMMHGYYFNLGTYSDVIGQFDNSNDKKLVARIIVDNDLVDYSNHIYYPELFGEISPETTDNIDVPNFTFGTSTVPNLARYTKSSVMSVTVTNNSDGTVYQAVVDWDTREINLKNNEESTIVISDATVNITYITLFTKLSLYIVNANETEIIDDDDTQLPQNYQVYDLELMYKTGGIFGLPLTNFAKFASPSISSIDGGII